MEETSPNSSNLTVTLSSVRKLFGTYSSRSRRFVISFFKSLPYKDVSLGCRSYFFLTLNTTQGLAHLHSLRILHRDVKPQNIFLDSQAGVKIGDLGFGRILGTECRYNDLRPASPIPTVAIAAVRGVLVGIYVLCISSTSFFWTLFT